MPEKLSAMPMKLYRIPYFKSRKKAYAKQHRKEYTNILYLTYTGNLMLDIADMDFADDLPDDSDQERFRKHNRFMRILKEYTLLIIDNFNTTASQDSTLSVVMKYRCRVLFTTRSRFDNYTSMEVEEITDKQALLSLARCFYSSAESHQDILETYAQAGVYLGGQLLGARS